MIFAVDNFDFEELSKRGGRRRVEEMKKTQIGMLLIMVSTLGCGMTKEEKKKCAESDVCFAREMFDTMRSQCISAGEREVPREYEDCRWRAGRNQMMRGKGEQSRYMLLHMVAQCTRPHERKKRGKRGAHSRMLCRYDWEAGYAGRAEIKMIKR